MKEVEIGALLLAALLAAVQGRAAAPGPDHVVDVHVDGRSASELNATRYDVHRPQVRDDAQAPVVNIEGVGSVSGAVAYSEQRKRPIYQYLGIPFAEAPVGERRFVAAVPKGPWEGVRDASAPGNICIQVESSKMAVGRRRRDMLAADMSTQSEDCLVLDVHTPKVDPSAKLPVLVFVHGGAFHYGYSGMKTPHGLLDDDMILVSPQYRLGPLGYMNLQTDEVPGNAGLMDIVEALRWVNKHISHFGGDPSRVTLGGHSAGAASASLLYLSPLTKGLIQGAMPMSGSALAFWSWDRYPEDANADITMMAGCGTAQTPMQQRVACLRNVTAERLVQSYGMVAINALLHGSVGLSGSTPSVQRAPNTVPVLPDWPENVVAAKNFHPLPYMTGVTKHEGTYPLKLAEHGFLEPTGLMSNTSFIRNDLVHVLMKVIWSDDSAGFVADAVVGSFFDPSTLGDYPAMRDGVIDLLGGFGFKSPARSIVQDVTDRGQPAFLYAFNHNGANTVSNPEGIYHGADQPYLFPRGAPLQGDDLKVALVLRKLVANFVIHQSPTTPSSPVTVDGVGDLSWPQFERDSEQYMELVWPPVQQQWFRDEFNVARRDGFNAGGTTSKAPKGTSSATTPKGSTTSSATSSTQDRKHDDQPEPNAAPRAVGPAPAAVLSLAVVLAAKWGL